MKKTIGLCMIVKNESEVILRCLESIRPIVDYVLIEDTGSTDGTQAIIREWLKRVGLRGEVYDEPWRDFAYNRSHALARLRQNKEIDYALILDADDVLELPPGFKIPYLKADSYTLEVRHQELRHCRPHLVRNALPWRYEGVLHEFLSCPVGADNRRTFPEERSQNRLAGVRIRISEEGARRQSSATDRYRRDAATLESALATETDPFVIARYTFYLAQSYRDCGEPQKAMANYLKRAELGYWDQEVFISLYQAAKLKGDLGFDIEDVLATYQRAQNVRKDRAEALHGAARFCRLKDRFEQGYKFAQRALGMKAPADGLFLEPWVYDYGVLDEYAVNAYWIGKFDDCRRACKRLLREGKIPADMRERIEQNARFAREKLSSPRADTKNEGTPKTIGLCMIVKNESKVIERCLESVRPIVDYVLIEDTGSTDGTQAIIRKWLKRVGLPGEVYDEPWQDFAYNRSHALARLREKRDIDYALIMDADDVLAFDEGFNPVSFKKNLSQDLYHVRIVHGPIWHSRVQICSNRREFRYRGVLHEFIEDAAGGSSSGTAEGFHMRIALEGARSQNPDKYRKDAVLLEKALQTEQDPFLRSRYTFYLAQSYRDAGEKEKALENYLKRAELGYWIDEVFMSLYGAAQAQQALGRPFSEVIAAYLRATDAAPHRAEALHAASRFCRESSKFAEGFEYARQGLAIALPPGGLFIRNWVYDYGLLDELAVNAYRSERYQDCLDACQRLLTEGKMPADMYDRVKKNADFARDKLASRMPANLAVPTIGSSQVIANAPQLARMKLILICGPWGSGTSAVAGMLERMGAFGLGPYFETADPNTSNSYESVPFRETIRYALGYQSQQTFSFPATARDAVQSGLRILQQRIEHQEFGPYDLRSPKPIFVKYPLSAFVIPQICEVFDTKLICVMRPLEDIERTRLRRSWPAYYGAEGASLIYNQMHAALESHSYPTINIDYNDLMASPMAQAGDIARFAGLDPSPAELGHAVDSIRKPDASASKEIRRDGPPQAASGDDPELTFASLYNHAARLRAQGRPFDEVMAAFNRASDAAPGRAEALHDASRLCRMNDKFADGHEYARRGLAITPPAGGLAVQQWIYDYGLLDEFAVNAFWIERYDDCLSACERLLQEGKISPDMRERVENNARFARENLRKQKSAKTADTVGEADEVFVSLYNAAARLRAEGRPFDDVIAAFNRAAGAAPGRAEALHDASRLCRINDKFAEGYEYARRGFAIPPPSGGGLSVQRWIYDYGLLDELAVNAYWIERYEECLEACQRLLHENKMPSDMHGRVKKNAVLAAEKLTVQALSDRTTTEDADVAKSTRFEFNTLVAQCLDAAEKSISAELWKLPNFRDWVLAARMPSCKTIGIVVPYRDREEHLKQFIPHMISYFRREITTHHNVRPLILISEQGDNRKFNRGFVKNVGFLALEPYCDYVCFHDVDYLPMWADYRETEKPTRIIWWGMHVRPMRLAPGSRLVTAVKTGLGTVAIFQNAQFRRVNGFSNLYEGWGFEDADLVYRCKIHGLDPQQKDGTYIPLDHDNAGFDDAGGKSVDWIENESRCEAAKLRYAAEGAVREGLTSVTIASLSMEVREWSGLDDSEKLRVVHLKSAQIDPRAVLAASPVSGATSTVSPVG